MTLRLDTFWMVQGDGPSTVRHSSPDAAEAEAERLARNNPGSVFFVMQAVSAHRRVDVERIQLSEYVPF
ncbi:hypothetical protein [Pseudooceanicola sp.]|uniref:hypothetical protein n=1 Tax=Pseudooceanicola sp. TaxID=1914328 RepID=UPI0035C6684D